ncbi:unnamed protein product, partial [Choristocarpus tenellus]
MRFLSSDNFLSWNCVLRCVAMIHPLILRNNTHQQQLELQPVSRPAVKGG